MTRTYDIDDTIVALSSGLEKSAISLIRFSGKKSLEIFSSLVKNKKIFENIKPNIIYKTNIYDAENLLDKILFVYYASPKSYTGQDMIEIFCHGSKYITQKIISLSIKNSARLALPGEFSFRSFINGKIDLTQAEAIQDLINSETEKEHKIAIKQLEGSLSLRIKNLKKELISLLSELEVRIDDSYEEMPALDEKTFKQKIINLKNNIEHLISGFEKGNFVKNGFRVCLTGLVNSGKSSLLNSILGYDRAIVDDTPGTTRDIIEEKININEHKIIFNDVAGINIKTSDKVEKEGINRGILAVKRADLVFFLSDISNFNKEEEEKALKTIKENLNENSSLVIIYSKSDLKSKRKIKNTDIKFSSFTKEGLDEIKKVIINFVENKTINDNEELIMSIRHFESLNKANESLNSFLKLKDIDKNLEIACENIRLSLNSLSEILGETTPEDLLKEIFSSFCIGK